MLSPRPLALPLSFGQTTSPLLLLLLLLTFEEPEDSLGSTPVATTAFREGKAASPVDAVNLLTNGFL